MGDYAARRGRRALQTRLLGCENLPLSVTLRVPPLPEGEADCRGRQSLQTRLLGCAGLRRGEVAKRGGFWGYGNRFFLYKN